MPGGLLATLGVHIRVDPRSAWYPPLMTIPDVLTAGHKRRLRWFAEHAGQTTFYPAPLEDGLLIVTRPKGIYKPAELEYAVSVRINLDSPYADGKVRNRPDGSWYFDYHQENPDPTHRDREYTNVGLLACIRDSVPVGVLRERNVARSARSEYDVLGLALPVGWRDGYFFFESARTGTARGADTASEILIETAEGALAEAESSAAPPSDDYDARRRVYREIVARRGQRRFRMNLLTAYSATCAITATTTDFVLDAAHLRPYRGPDSNVTSNGLLLRTDVHTLLDLQLLAIAPEDRTVVVADRLRGTEYARLAGTRIREPGRVEDRPADEVLSAAFDDFIAAEAMR